MRRIPARPVRAQSGAPSARPVRRAQSGAPSARPVRRAQCAPSPARRKCAGSGATDRHITGSGGVLAGRAGIRCKSGAATAHDSLAGASDRGFWRKIDCRSNPLPTLPRSTEGGKKRGSLIPPHAARSGEVASSPRFSEGRGGKAIQGHFFSVGGVMGPKVASYFWTRLVRDCWRRLAVA